MKTCPSCNASCDDPLRVCPVCGHAFDDVTQGDSGKRTMMGFPSLGGSAPADEEEEDEPVKQTLFGFPANKTEALNIPTRSHADDEDDEDEADDATSIIPPSELDFDDDHLRGTIAGNPRPGQRVVEDEEEEEADKTEIVSGSAYFAAAGPGDDKPMKGTLMGMSLKDIEEAEARRDASNDDGNRSTRFAIPAVQTEEDEANELEEESEEPIEDSPTMAWNPADELESPGNFDPDGRKKLLEKIRRSKPLNRQTDQGGLPAARKDGPKGPDRSTGPGEGLDLSALRKLRPKRDLVPTPAEFPEDAASERDTQEEEAVSATSSTPQQGVIRAPKRPSRPSEPPKPGGNSSYIYGRGEAPGGASGGPEKPDGVAIGAIKPKQIRAPIEPAGDLGDALSDPEFAFAETGIAKGDLVQEAFNYGQSLKDTKPDDNLDNDVTNPTGNRGLAAPQGETAFPTGGGRIDDSRPFDPSLSGLNARPGSNVHEESPPTVQSMPSHKRPPSGPATHGSDISHQSPFSAPGQPPQPAGYGTGPGPVPGQAPTGTGSGPTPHQATDQYPYKEPYQPPRDPYPAPQDPYQAPPDPYQQPHDPYAQPHDPYGAPPSGSMPQGAPHQQLDHSNQIYQTMPPVAGEDPLVRRIQSLFGFLAGIVTLGVSIVVMFSGKMPEDSKVALFLVALAITLGVAAIGVSLLPASARLKTWGLGALGILLILLLIPAPTLGIPNSFLALSVGAFVCFMAAGFPRIAKMIL